MLKLYSTLAMIDELHSARSDDFNTWAILSSGDFNTWAIPSPNNSILSYS